MTDLVGKYGTNWFRKDSIITGNQDRIKHSDFWLMTEYWHSSLEIVLETYEKYGLNDENVDKLLDMPLRKDLKKLRNGSFHFREDYSDPNVFSFFKVEGSFQWITLLQDAMLKYLEKEERKLVDRSDIEVRKVYVTTK